MPQERIIAQLWLQITDGSYDRQQLVDGVVAQVIRGSVRAAALGHDLHFNATLVAAINLHLGWLADHDKIGAHLGVYVDEGIGSNAIAVFFHIAEHITGESVEQAEVAGNSQTIDHARRRAFFIAGATSKKNAVFNLTLEGIPLPGVRVGNAHGVNMGVIDDHARAAADAAHDVAHLVEAHFIVAQLFHLLGDTFADRFDLPSDAGNRANCTKEGADGFLLRGHALLNFRHRRW